jgi:hypothetical protein
MALNKNQRDKISAHVAAVATNPCQICGASSWQVDDRFLFVSEDPVEMGRFAMRVIPVGCDNCGQVVLFSARFLEI